MCSWRTRASHHEDVLLCTTALQPGKYDARGIVDSNMRPGWRGRRVVRPMRAVDVSSRTAVWIDTVRALTEPRLGTFTGSIPHCITCWRAAGHLNVVTLGLNHVFSLSRV